MTDRARILVVAATARELAAAEGWRTLICGVGPVEAAAHAGAALAADPPAAVLHVGIAGARRAAGIAPASLVIGESSQYADLGVSEQWAPSKLAPPPALLLALRSAFPDATVAAIATTGRVGGGGDINVEAMEGFAVLRAAALAGIPAVEVRAISNDVEEADRGKWHVDAACAAITAATPRLVETLARCLC